MHPLQVLAPALVASTPGGPTRSASRLGRPHPQTPPLLRPGGVTLLKLLKGSTWTLGRSFAPHFFGAGKKPKKLKVISGFSGRSVFTVTFPEKLFSGGSFDPTAIRARRTCSSP